MLTEFALGQIMRRAAPARLAQYLNPLNEAMAEFGIDTYLRAAAFLAQIGHESGGLVWLQERWGPTEAQKRCERPSRLAQRLGNTQPGDGARFRGRGPIQITGRANYLRYGTLLGIDLVNAPERAAQPDVGFRIAGMYWQRNGLNDLADLGEFDQITQRIDGGQNGQADRQRLYALALSVLSPSDFPARAGAMAAPAAVEKEPLSRGWELLKEAAPPVRAATRGTKRGSSAASARGPAARRFDARRDTMDFRDQMFVPTLVEVPPHVPLGEYVECEVPILDQGQEGACTGYGLATVVHYLLRRRRVMPDHDGVSPRMLYEMARRYDEWPGQDYEGSSARGAMKGWHKHGVCGDTDWPSDAPDGGLNEARVGAARRRPLGAYFRVNHRDLVAMHAAIAEVGILYATATVHSGWEKVDAEGTIPLETTPLGGHAFAIVAYDTQGFWIQNSWGPDWGLRGFAHISYDDWLSNGTDVWVARLGAPVELRKLASTAALQSGRSSQAIGYAYEDLRPHVISVGNGGWLSPGDTYGTSESDVRRLFEQDIPRVMTNWPSKRIVLYVHGGLVPAADALQRVAEYRPALLAQQCYLLAFVWHSDFGSTLRNILADAVSKRRSGGWLDEMKDFLLDRLDDMLEPLARQLLGKLAWDEMKENAVGASQKGRAADVVVHGLVKLKQRYPELELHLVGHSAGSIFLGPLLARLGDAGLTARTCTLWAPACTHQDFEDFYQPALTARRGGAKALEQLTLFMLTDAAEQDDNCALIYNKSLLYLAAHALERQSRIPGDPRHPGVPLLGMAKFLDPAHPDYKADFKKRLDACGVECISTPNDDGEGTLTASKASRHGDFDNDKRTVLATFSRILGSASQLGAESVRDPMTGGQTTRVQVTNPDMLVGDEMVTLKLGESRSAASARRQVVDRLSRPVTTAN